VLGNLFFLALGGFTLWWAWARQAPRLRAAHEAGLEGEVIEIGAMRLPKVDCSIGAAHWSVQGALCLMPLREQMITWRDRETGVITQFLLQTPISAKPRAVILSSTTAAA